MSFSLMVSGSFVRSFSPSASFDVSLVVRSKSCCPERPAPMSAVDSHFHAVVSALALVEVVGERLVLLG